MINFIVYQNLKTMESMNLKKNLNSKINAEWNMEIQLNE